MTKIFSGKILTFLAFWQIYFFDALPAYQFGQALSNAKGSFGAAAR
jgi:hypothetical protein